MVDFNKLRLKKDRTLVTYQCEKCGARDEYIIELPDHMRSHTPIGGRCGGRLIEVARRTEPHEVSR